MTTIFPYDWEDAGFTVDERPGRAEYRQEGDPWGVFVVEDLIDGCKIELDDYINGWEVTASYECGIQEAFESAVWLVAVARERETSSG